MNSQKSKKLWDTAKAVLRGKFIAIQAYLKKIETFQTNNLIYTYRNRRNNNKDSPEQAEEGNNQDQSRVK